MSLDLNKFDPHDADDFIELALEGLGAIATLVGGDAGSKAVEVLAGVKAVVAAIFDGYDGKVTFDEARTELQKFTDSLAANDASTDAALARKFVEEAKPEPGAKPKDGDKPSDSEADS